MNENLPNLQEWATSLIGRDWEIYWKPENPAEDQQNENEDEDEDMEDVEDWYDGHIVDIDYRKEDGNFSFRVTFVGDDTVYKMVLEPTWVRPAARAWITRSKAILTYQSTRLKQPTSTEEWDKSLPSDTSTLEDKETLAQMETQQEEDAPLTAGDALQAQVSKGQNFPSNEEVSEVRRLLTVLKKQIYLRSRLAPIVEHPGDGGPSEVYVDHLFQCLKYLESACQWYLECWNLHKRVFFPCPASSSTGSSNQQSAKLNEDFTIQEGLQKGRHAVIQVLKADTSLAAAKRRRQPEHSPTMGRRKTKRRRKNKSFQEIVKENERGGEQPNPQEDEFLSVEVVNDFVEQLWSQDNRWYLRNFGKMLLSLSLNIVTPLLSWRRRVEALLGDRSVVDANTSDSATTSEEEEDIDAVEKHGEEGSLPQDAASSVHGKRYYTYDEIKSFEESANGDQVLRHFDLAMWQDRLRQKASDVEKFENHAWEVLSQLFGKPAMMGGDAKEADEIYSQLLKLRSDATTCDSPVANVSPLGNVTSMLTRKVIDDSIAIRSWYLDLKRVEASKERLVFIDQMVSRAAELPRMPPCVHSASLDSLFDEAVARLKNISQKYFDHMPRFDKYKSLLLARSSASNDDGLDFLSKEGVSRALQELGDIRVLSLAEEMLSVRFDVLSWKDKAESLLSRKEAPFEELDDLHKMLDMLVRGRSSSRMTTLTSIEPNASIDEEIQSFAKTDISTLSGSLTSIVKSKYSETKSWKERADSIINALEQHNSQQLSTQKPPPMVDLKRINSLLAEYNRLGIYLPNHYTLLVQECTKANLWSLELTNTLADTSKALSALIPYLQESKTNRPKGIIVDPARHVVDNLLDLLLWHHQVAEAQKQTSQSTLKQGSGQTDSKALYPLISEGSEILELFTSKSDRIRFAVSSAGAVALIAKQLDSRRPVRVISRNKLETNPLGKIILGRLISEDNKEGYPLSFLVYLLWRITMFDFVESYESRRGKKDGMTLKEAQTLILQKPIPEALDRRTSTSDFMADVDNVNANWGFNYSDKEKQLMQLIQEGESKEESALKALATAKELFRGPSRHAEEICEHIVKVKDLLHQFKSIRTEGTGLFLSRKLENNLEQNLKALTWVVSSCWVVFACFEFQSLI